MKHGRKDRDVEEIKCSLNCEHTIERGVIMREKLGM